MSSVLYAFARRVPKAAGFVSSSGAGAGATRTRSLRMLSAGPRSGLSRPSGSSSPLLSALAPRAAATVAAGSSLRTPGSISPQQQQQHQQHRWLSIEAENNKIYTEDGGGDEVVVMEAAPPAEATAAVAEEGEPEETATSPSKTDPLFLVRVDGLPFSMSQEEVEQWFVDCGSPPSKIFMPMWPELSSRAGSTKGTAFLHFDSEDSTQAALALSGKSLGERWISISRLAIPLEEATTVTIKGLGDISKSELAGIFKEAVGVAPTEVSIMVNHTRPRGLAFVKFENPDLARAALVLDASKIRDQWVDVSLYVPKQDRSVPSFKKPFKDVPDELVVVLKGLPFSLVEDEIKAFLLSHNIREEDVLGVHIPKYENTQMNRGFAMFHLKTDEAVETALMLKGTYIGERWVDVSRFNERELNLAPAVQSKRAEESTRASIPSALRRKHPDLPVVAISGLPFQKSKEEFIDFLETNGVPTSAMVEVEMPPFLRTERNTGWCWLVVDDEKAYNSLMDLHGAVFDERWLTVADA